MRNKQLPPDLKAPSNERFDIVRDIAIEKAGGIFCRACLTGRTDLSPDPRYCNACHEVVSNEKAVTTTDHWSDCGQVHFCGGKGYGISSALKTVCVGNEAEILEAFVTGKIPEGLNETQKQVLRDILAYRKEEMAHGRKQPQIKRPGAVRSKPTRTFEHRAATTRQPPPRKKLPIHPVKRQMQGVLGL